ncbi:MAG TPA: site-specific DNA-methyltransferase [Candidatus Polarisedimenticolia bacterium]|jgi:adenine-specific DNA-methyltransferase|nr:site-specific DNA-methyltransferase [Nitrospirales bacterium]HEV8701817.1 site-specific DNA-methyltransferase [Candidatus Polarisedimenticolia bacterium]
MAKKAKPKGKSVEALRHADDKRKNIPTAEHESVIDREQRKPLTLRYPRNADLDPQLVWRGKDEQDWSDLVVHAPPLYIQEKIHPKVLIDDLLRQTKAAQPPAAQPDLFADFNGLPESVDRTEFYQHDQNWSNRMILGDSLQVMASLAEREGLQGKVQFIYIDPPYGIKFNSNFQWSTTSRDVKEKADHITRESEQVKAFRDTWRDGIHSYLTYLRDRLTVARALLTDSGSIFIQIGDENVHRVRAVMDEVFGDANFVSLICYSTTGGFSSASTLSRTGDYLLWYSRDISRVKYRQLHVRKDSLEAVQNAYDQIELASLERRAMSAEEKRDPSVLPDGSRAFTDGDPTSQGTGAATIEFLYHGRIFHPGEANHWKAPVPEGMRRLASSNRLQITPKGKLRYVRYLSDFDQNPITNSWFDVAGAVQDRADPKIYVVQTSVKIVQRCLLMTTDPGDLVLDPTCGAGTTATVSEKWGRRWITIDTSRVALALARARIMGARYPYYLLADSREGQLKEAEITHTAPGSRPVHGNIRHGFVYERVPHVTLKSIANNAEIDVIWEKWQTTLEPLREKLSVALNREWREWEIPREANATWPDAAKKAHACWWEARIARQKEIDASIAAKGEFEDLYDKPYEDKKIVRVAGPFTVESLSPHRVLGVDEDDQLIDPFKATDGAPGYGAGQTFEQIILENLKTAGVQQAHKEDKIQFISLTGWPGTWICAEGRYREGGREKRAGIFIGPEFGTVSRPDLVESAREAGDAGFDVVIACAFNYDAHAGEFHKLGRVPVLKARMNADLHMATDLKTTGKGNLFVIFGEPDIEVESVKDGKLRVTVKGVDVFDPTTGEIRSDSAEGIACWMIDTDYNGESFFVRHAYFLGQNDPYSALKTSLKAEIDADAWASLNSAVSRPFDKPKSGRIAVKVINHLGDEVMKVFRM